MKEVPLVGGRFTEGVVRVGDTVRRPRRRNSQLVRALLAQLQEQGFDGAPRHLGTDQLGREVFSFLPGEVPPDLDPTFKDETLARAARLIRRFHDATAGTALAADGEVICHNDLSPCNFVFRDGEPIGIIDFDAAGPGRRLEDVALALFLWLNLATDGPQVTEQARRINLFCRAYGTHSGREVIDAILAAVSGNIDELRANHRFADVEWWQTQLDWLHERRSELTELVRQPG